MRRRRFGLPQAGRGRRPDPDGAAVLHTRFRRAAGASVCRRLVEAAGLTRTAQPSSIQILPYESLEVVVTLALALLAFITVVAVGLRRRRTTTWQEPDED